MLRTDPASYTHTAKFLHWLIAFGIVFMLALGWGLEFIPGPYLGTAFMVHKTCGVLILLLSLFRLGWRVAYHAPSLPETMARWERVATRIGHAALYFMMIALPLSGWALVSASPRNIPTMLFGVWQWPHIGFLRAAENRSELAGALAESHEIMAFIMALLVVGHVVAALKHHFISRDFILIRMAPRRCVACLLRLRGE